ncbi:MAG: TonB-dependent receptor [Gammaproteobacteria bacterium]|nr:TonB-dependent receptor [Gammaproteobacteria bacterium]
MLTRDDTISTQQKALSINLDEHKYGSIVEIGAGQEVARQFFKAGAAAGTIAKTSSAYDMTMSDSIYGKAGRYVSRERVHQMLDYEFKQCVEILTPVRPKLSTYFSYAATVTARSFKGGNECHGWIGVKLQLRPKEDPCEIICHVRMLDNSNDLQSEALGILGVNLIYGAFKYNSNPTWLIQSLHDGLSMDRIEVDLINFSGPGFDYIDNRLTNLHLVSAKLTRAVLFDANGVPQVPRDFLYKRPVVVLRGSYKPPTLSHRDMETCAVSMLSASDDIAPEKFVRLAEISISDLMGENRLDDEDFLARVDLANAMGFPVLLSDYVRYFSLRTWIRRHTKEPIGIVMKTLDVEKYLFNADLYSGLDGQTLEGLGKLFADNTRVLVAPVIRNGELQTLENVSIPEDQSLIAKQLIKNKKLLELEGYNEELLAISAREIIGKIPSDDDSWEPMLDPNALKIIKQRKLFGCP